MQKMKTKQRRKGRWVSIVTESIPASYLAYRSFCSLVRTFNFIQSLNGKILGSVIPVSFDSNVIQRIRSQSFDGHSATCFEPLLATA